MANKQLSIVMCSSKIVFPLSCICVGFKFPLLVFTKGGEEAL